MTTKLVTVTDQTLKIKTWVLKVSIDCEGCQKKVQKILGGVEGVYATVVEAQHNQVTVTGHDVDADKLIKRLARSGKHAELILPEEKENSKKQSNPKDKGRERKADAAVEDPKTGGYVGKRRKNSNKEKKSGGSGNNEATIVVGSPVSTLPPLDPEVGVMDPIRFNANDYEDEQSGCFIM